MPRKVKYSLTSSQFNVALRAMGMYDYDDLSTSMTAAKAVLVFGHTQTEAARMFGISSQAVSQAVLRTINADQELPGRHRLCPSCGQIWEENRKGARDGG